MQTVLHIIENILRYHRVPRKGSDRFAEAFHPGRWEKLDGEGAPAEESPALTQDPAGRTVVSADITIK